MNNGLQAKAGLLTVFVIGIATFSVSGFEERPEAPISLEELSRRGVQGRLGLRLGTIAEIAGTIVPNPSTFKGQSQQNYLIRVETIDGAELKSPVLFNPESVTAPESLPVPTIGSTFQMIAYETGRYSGAPRDLFKYVPPAQTYGHSFHTNIVVVIPKK
ncbi:hypothetical protein GC163_16670 [bacterium]|nr:hypothetical protein [bacterium]